MMDALFVLVLIISSITVQSQDPTAGWLGYAMAEHEQKIITRLEVYWQNIDSPKTVSNAFYSPWIGIGTSDGLNIIQCVNPWIGSEWQSYTEYFQWNPERNKNSISHVTYPGDIFHSVIEYKEMKFNGSNVTATYYHIQHSDITQHWTIDYRVEIQQNNVSVDGMVSNSMEYKRYTFAYFAFSTKNVSMECNLYPSSGSIRFYNISLWFEDKLVKYPRWKLSYHDDSCHNRAILDPMRDNDTVIISWNTLSSL